MDAAGTSGRMEAEIDVKALTGQEAKIKELMGRDPRFIARLIQQLDSQMHKMMLEKHKRMVQIKEDQAALDKIDDIIKTHVQPNLDRVVAELDHKSVMHEQVQQQLDSDMESLKNLEREAAALISRARHASGKLMGKTASNSLLQSRGFSSTMPTTQLIAKKKKPI